MAKEVKVGGAYVEIGAKGEKAKKVFAAIGKSLKNVGAQMAKMGAKIAGLGAAMVGPLLLAAKSWAKFGDDIGKIAARVGLTTKAISELGFVAAIVGQDLFGVEKAVRGMQRAIFDAKRGSSEIIDALKELGITYKDLADLSPEEQFELIGDRLGKLTNSTMKSAIAMKVFGRAGAALIPMFALGKKGIEALRKEAQELGVSMSDTSGAEELTDNLFRVSQAMQGIKNTIATILGPALEDATLRITGVLVATRKWIELNPQVVESIFRVGKALLMVGSVMAGIGAVILIAMHPVLFLIGAISIAVLSILESFGLVNVGINSGLKSIFSSFTIFGKSLKDWGGMLTRTLTTLFWSLFEGIVKGIEWAVAKIEAPLAWIEEKFARFFDLILGVDKETSDAASIARKNERAGGNRGIPGQLKRLRGNLTERRDAAARNALDFDIESDKRGKDLPSFSSFIDKMKDLLSSKFEPIKLPKLGDLGGIGRDGPLPDKKSIVGFFGGTGSFAEILGGLTKSNDELQLSEARKQTSILGKIADNTKGGAATYA